MVFTRRELKTRSNDLFIAGKAVRASRELGELYRSKAARLEERARQETEGSQLRYRDMSIQCNDTDAILDVSTLYTPGHWIHQLILVRRSSR